MRRVPALDSRAGDEDGDVVAVVKDSPGEALDFLLVPEVGCVDGGLTAEGLYLLLGCQVGLVSLERQISSDHLDRKGEESVGLAAYLDQDDISTSLS